MIGISKMQETLVSLAREAWGFEDINVWINGNGITVAPRQRLDMAVNFTSFVEAERRDAYRDAVDYFRAERLLVFLQWYL